VDDLRDGNLIKQKYKGKKIKGCLVTNTRFTKDAIRYSKCVGLQLMSWDYPLHGSLKDKVELSGLYPITCLTSLKKKEKTALLNQGISKITDIAANAIVLEQFKVSKPRKNAILAEIIELSNPKLV
jgi:hypothetical protein